MARLKKRLVKNVKRIYKAFNKIEMRVLPGNMAFFFVLALIPIIAMIIAIVSHFSVSPEKVTHLLEAFLPSGASNVVVNAVLNEKFTKSFGLFSLIAIFVATNGTYAIINAANSLYGVRKSEAIRDRVKSVVLLVILLLLIIFVLLVPVLGGRILNNVNNSDFVNNVVIIYRIIKWPFTFFMIFLTLKLVYTISPSKRISSSTTTYGALFTTIVWIIATVIFSYYLRYIANYGIIYGSLSGMIILIIWIYLISYVLVFGIAINSVFNDEIEDTQEIILKIKKK